MQKPEIDLGGKVVVITGAAKGIGRESALQLAAAGGRVVINYRGSRDEAEALADQIGRDAAIPVRADVGDPIQTQALIDATVERFGGVNIVVNNAAIFKMNPFDGDDYGAWQRAWREVFEVNVFGAANV